MTARPALAAMLIVASCGGDAGCGSDETDGSAREVDVALDFYVNPDHAGLYVGLDRGDFEDRGLAVSPHVPSDPSAPIRQVAAGQVDVAISYEPEVVLAREEGLPVIAVAAIVPRPLTSLISLPAAEIESAADLEGKTIATAGIAYQTAFLEAILEREGLDPGDVTRTDVGLNLLPAVLSGEADAMLGGFLNVEGVDLELRGENPRVVPVNRLGIPTYDELVLVASEETVAEDPELVRDFIAALERGTRAAAADPQAATAAILDAGEGLEPSLTAAEIERTLSLLLPEGGRRPFGHMDRAEWRRFAAFMADRGLIDEAPPAADLLTNELLP